MDLNISFIHNLYLRQNFGFLLMLVSGLLVSHCFIFHITNSLYLIEKRRDFDPSYDWRFSRNQSAILGFIERALFITALLINVPKFIPFWFTIKMVVKWQSWSKKNGRLLFNNFLIGNGLSFLFSISAYLIYKTSFIHDQYVYFSFLGMAIISVTYILSIGIVIWINCFNEKYNEKMEN